MVVCAAGLFVAAGMTGLAAMSGKAPLVREHALPPLSGTTAGQGGQADLVRPRCPVSPKLVPACGRWWGVAPAALTSTPRDTALTAFESTIGRRADIHHAYHRDGTVFPTAVERQLADDPAGKRLLFINWKPSTTHTWREIAEGRVDERLAALAAHINSTFADRFFLSIWHEPENDVITAAESGMTADDYAAMYRHVVLGLQSRGVDNAVTVMTYMGSPVWRATDWFPALYPGDDVVDWIGVDPYIYASPKRDIEGDFRDLVDAPGQGVPGFYTWARAAHPSKPIMLSEWGVFSSSSQPWRKARVYRSVARQIHAFPAIKALVYFDSPVAPKGDTRVDSDPQAEQAFRDLGRDAAFIGPAVP